MLGLRRLSRGMVTPQAVSRFASGPGIYGTTGSIRNATIRNAHFRVTNVPHPLKNKPSDQYSEADLANKFGRQQNHIWSLEELKEATTVVYHHKPKTISDYVMRTIMNVLYHSFNFLTGYNKENPSVKSIEWRLILLESVAGLPGFIGAGFRHFRSLRRIEKDGGFIATLLEEAENERMHLLVCFKMFGASFFVRTAVLALQCALAPILSLVYFVHHRSMHRFVGYLEETATETYIGIANCIETPGTHLHAAWKDTPAPDMAKGYWMLPNDAKWVDTIRCICADETHHRDVNHTYASLKAGEINPYLDEHRKDAAIAWRLKETGQTAWPAKSEAAKSLKTDLP